MWRFRTAAEDSFRSPRFDSAGMPWLAIESGPPRALASPRDAGRQLGRAGSGARGSAATWFLSNLARNWRRMVDLPLVRMVRAKVRAPLRNPDGWVRRVRLLKW